MQHEMAVAVPDQQQQQMYQQSVDAALALGLDPADPDVMQRPPRAQGSSMITRSMWIRIVFVGLIMALGTLGMLDASLPGDLIEGTGSLAYARTMAFTTLMLFQLFNVFNASDTASIAQTVRGRNWWLWAALVLLLGLHVLVIYMPLLQPTFSTVSLSLGDWGWCMLVASSVLWLRELSKFATRSFART